MVNLFQKHRSFFTVLGGLIILVVIIALASYFQSRAEASNQNLSTPELIDRAYNRGQITEEERLLYLAYAIYEHESLPARFESSFEWFGDDVADKLDEVVNSPAKLCSMSLHVRSELLRLIKKTEEDAGCN